jgi:anti-anti-sigma regulatory factor
MIGVGMASGRSHTWESARGRLIISEPTAGVMVFTYDGHMTEDVVPFIEATVDRVLAEGLRPDLFIDLDRLTSYDSAYRKAISRWGARLHRRFGEVRVFVRSRLVAMGIAVSNLTASNKLKPTTSRAQFQAALDESIRQRLRQAATRSTA